MEGCPQQGEQRLVGCLLRMCPPLDFQLPYHTLSVDILDGPHPYLLGGNRNDSGGRRGPALHNGTEVHKVSRVLQAEVPHLTTPPLLLSVLHHPVLHKMMMHVCTPL